MRDLQVWNLVDLGDDSEDERVDAGCSSAFRGLLRQRASCKHLFGKEALDCTRLDNRASRFAAYSSPLTDSVDPLLTMEVFDRLQQLAEKAEAR
jgi:hypothetical protein